MKTHLVPLTKLSRLALWLLLSAVPARAADLLTDHFESGLAGWQASGLWGLTTGRAASPTQSVADSPGAFYSNNSDTTLTLASAVNLSSTSRPVLSFFHSYELENGYDFGRVEISTNNGTTWQATPLASYTGSRPAMGREQLDLSAYGAQSQVKVRFRMVTDASVVMDGWYVDDVIIGSAPVATVLATPVPADIAQTSVALHWTASSDPAFASYVILRGTSAGFDWRTAKVVATITDSAVVTVTDIAVAPKSSYRYVVMTLNSAGLHALSNEISLTTPAGMDYPFLDDGEAGPNLWVATSPWAISDEDFKSPGHAWSDSPGGNYADGVASQALTLAAPLDLSTSTNPVLSFHHRYDLAAGDTLSVEASTNLGSSWAALDTYAAGTAPWKQRRLPLTSYAGQASVLLRFRITTNASANADGWHVDDISVAEAPAVMPAPAIDQISSHSMRLNWNASTALPFSHYAIHRSASTGVDFNSPRVAMITNQATTTFTDTGLALDTLYYYRIYAVSPYGTYSADSPTEAVARSLNNPLPFVADFEGNLIAWNFGSDAGTNTWGLSTSEKHTGVAALASSPGASYLPNTNTWTETAVDLRNTEWPVLTFWDRYGLNTGDWMRLEISAAGGPTIHPYGTYESSRTEWRRQRVDLSPWKGLGNVKLRFRLVSDGAVTPGEGWFIDDVGVAENPNRNNPIPLPLTDDFETGATGWLLSTWGAETEVNPVNGASSFRFGAADRRMGIDLQQWAVLDRPVNLAAGSNVQATFWVRGRLDAYSSLRLQYSADGGVNWPEFSTVNRDTGFNTVGVWQRSQASLASLSPSSPQTVRLRFAAGCNNYAPIVDLGIDKFTLAEMPAAVALTTAIPSLRTMDLTWTGTTLAGAFQRYELWRSTAANVSITNGQKIFETTNPATLTYTDTGLNIGGTYFYKVFTVDTRDTYIPLTDSMDTMANWVSGSNNANPSTWAVRTDNPHGGTGSLATVSTGQYVPSTDSYIETAVDLRGTAWPVLTFWDHYGLNTGDWMRLEISAAGGPSIPTYGSYEGSRSGWRRQRIDLSPWKGLSNVKLRFRLTSDAPATAAEGWFIDDVSVTENPNRNTPITLPYTDDFESNADGWLLSGWGTQTDATAVDGTSILRDGGSASRMGIEVQQWAVLDRPVILPLGSNVQATYWVRGRLDAYSALRLHYSPDGGVSWPEFGSVNRDTGFNTMGEWLRSQASLYDLSRTTAQTVRLRFATSANNYAPILDIGIDKFTLAEMPAAVALTSAIPALRSVDVSWSATTLGASFARYEVWRSTAANVSVTNGTKVFTSTNPATLTFGDTGLNIGGTYFYKVFVVDNRDTYIPSNELSATTVPLILPVSDSMDSMANWVTGSNNSNPSTWVVNPTNPHGGSGSIATVAVGQYAPSTDSYIETAVDLRATQWPVLTFWDRYGLNTGDWMRLEISATGGPSIPTYGSYERSRSGWRRQRIDLSPWKGLSNVKLRFRLTSDAPATAAEGWFIDDVSVTENPNRNTPITLPYTDDFESNADGWLLSGWGTQADAAAVDGASILQDGGPTSRMGIEVQQWAVLDRPVILPLGSNVQATYWVRGRLDAYSALRLHYSADGGVSWPEFGNVNRDTGFNTNGSWLRSQASLYDISRTAAQTVRLRFATSANNYAPILDIGIDKFTLAEMPVTVAMQPITDVNVTSMRLNWTPSTLPSFASYAIFRSTAAAVTNDSTLVTTITNQGTGTFVDTGLEARIQYYYRVYVIDNRDTYSPSEIVSATTLGMTVPLTDTFETVSPGWTFTGQWQLQDGVGRNGGKALVDSPGDNLPSTDTHARFAVNLDGMQWPVLRFWDKHAFGGSSWGRVEVSVDGVNYSWFIYGIAETRNTWQMQEIDLSQWKKQQRVFIRFRRGTDGSLADGWTIDDLSIADIGVASSYPIFANFESGFGDWLASSWAPVTDEPFAGTTSLQDTINRRNAPDAPNYLSLGQEVDLTNAITPQLTYFVRGSLTAYSSFRVQYSTNGGLDWAEISELNLDTGFTSLVWLKKQTSLAAWKGQKIRLRFVSSSNNYMPFSDIFLDNIGIGEPTPGAPVLVTPSENQTVPIVRPTLTVTNAVDYQSDALTHQFEVYSDAALTQLVAQIPTVASGVTTTAWQVDIDLQDHAPYWWRARASDGTNVGPWTNAIVFNINEFNNPPLAITIASPADDSVMLDGNGLLVWIQTSDPDLGDEVRDYHIQIDDDETFASPNIDHTGITVDPATYGYLAGIYLNELPGSAALPSGRWFWRIRARDTRFASGAWSPGYNYFRLPTFYQRYLRSVYADPDWFLYDVTNPQADPDGNGVGVLMDFACAITPGTPPGDRLPKPIEVTISGRIHQGFEMTRRKISELDFLLETSSYLSGWQTDTRATVEVLHSVDAISERIRIIDPDPTGTQRRHFIRLKVED
jgi:hypothetical protein